MIDWTRKLSYVLRFRRNLPEILRGPEKETWSERIVADFLGVSRRHIDHFVLADASFPRPHFMGGTRVWSAEEVAEWMRTSGLPSVAAAVPRPIV